MAPKRTRASSSNSSAPIPQVPGYEGIEFTSRAHHKKFLTQLIREVHSTRFLCHETLRALMLYDMMLELCNNIGLTTLFNLSYNIHKRIMYEFLASVEFTENMEDTYESTLTFRYNNIPRTLTKREFAELFGLPVLGVEERKARNDKTIVHDLWRRMTGVRVFKSSHMHITHVQHPALRIALKWFGYNVFGKPNNHQTRISELAVLAMGIFPEAPRLDVASCLWEHLKNQCETMGDVYIGGYMHHICTKFGYQANREVGTWHFLNLDFLLTAHDLSHSHTIGTTTFYHWTIYPSPTHVFTIPSDELPNIFNHQLGDGRHLCLPGTTPDHYLDEIPQLEPPPIPNPPQDQPQAEPQHPQYSPFEQQMLQSMNSLNLNYTQFREEFGLFHTEHRQSIERLEAQLQNQRQQYDDDRRRYEEDQRRTYGPIYSYIAHQGSFSSMATPPPPPSWYDPTAWGTFGGSTSGGGGGGGGEGGDGGYGGYFDGGDAGGH
ncbi:unnamed protein product [Cuscuta epithymum]|uniref:Arabidopsis retrotransposon Orf1 C-terminal domain-containing protein n=1 Tax=Cuscuta epithymum TaxID=186058 RepID=A0AAV0E3C5_9ASTE|nr:unnamed protein product [Cuscuta epithymum]CAH9147046.1 unnamed protein product [Cuscuta epithymum]